MSNYPNNNLIIDILTQLIIYRKLNGDNRFKIAANQKAISEISSLNFNIISSSQLKDIPGIGEGISYHISNILKYRNDEYLTGIKELDNLDDETYNKISFMSKAIEYPGVGIIRAEKFYDNGITTIKELEKTLKTNVSNKRQKIGVDYVENINQLIPHKSITPFKKILKPYFDKYNLSFEIVGSYARNTKFSKDIDILVHPASSFHKNAYSSEIIENTKEIIGDLIDNNIILETLSFNQEKFEGIAYLNEEFPAVRLDMLIVNNLEYPFAKLYFIGNKNFNIFMRQTAKKLGYKLSNTNMMNKYNEYISVKSEKDIFNILNIEYLPPTERNY